jgi:L-aspartate oxidase
VHGANRLASNSLLEGLVFGARAGRAMRSHAGSSPGNAERPVWTIPDVTVSQLRDLAWKHGGILRSREGLESAIATLENMNSTPVAVPGLLAIELRNIFEVTGLIARSALWREESRGAHYRTDFPEKKKPFLRDSLLKRL